MSGRLTLHAADELREMGHQLIRMADEMSFEPRERKAKPEREFEEYDLRSLAGKAGQLYKIRQMRNKIFPSSIFGEPAWDIMLDLFMMFSKNKRVSVTSACVASNVPATTALRWIEVLCGKGMIERIASEQDARVTYLQLTKLGLSKMSEVLAWYAEDQAIMSRAPAERVAPTVLSQFAESISG